MLYVFGCRIEIEDGEALGVRQQAAALQGALRALLVKTCGKKRPPKVITLF
jgi:hypothetical protein